MAKKLAIGIVYAPEMPSRIGHVACTLGGVNYESRGSRGIIKGRSARGATSRLFRHHFYVIVSDAAGKRAKEWADAQVGEPYVWGRVPGHGGDCSGYVSGIICKALNRPVRRLFGTESWPGVYRQLGFKPGLGPPPVPAPDGPPPYPGTPLQKGSKGDNVRAVQRRLNRLGAKLETDGIFGDLTHKAVVAFQKKARLEADGIVGPKTWAALWRAH